ncbi:hypothetical protein RFI_22932 [Reticulomyxa filosa]|uniref:T-complex protein 1 subunit delta n=1 Tax=Reticulomyxa filosa TaxID=46433 RepID=X6MMY7_RETFI|nr:hypothetical protein RFI_22932 [Reticulomyxa filosa]|eukprot:ETO14435.1 hypothetical protein RFI_22932 [Reticulomyxa filosa]
MSNTKGDIKQEKEKQKDVRLSNMLAARGVADAVRTSLGPKGMDKMITDSSGDVIITNDGYVHFVVCVEVMNERGDERFFLKATILSKMEVEHPAAKMQWQKKKKLKLVELSKSQDVEAGDGTTSVCVLAGSLLETAEFLLSRGIHPGFLADTWKLASGKAVEILRNTSVPVDLTDKDALIRAATTSLSSKVVSQYSNVLAPIAVDAVLSVIDPKTATNVDLRDIRVVTRLGETIEETKLIDGIVFKQEASKGAGGPIRIENPKIGLIQFQISPPKTDVSKFFYLFIFFKKN